MDMNRADERSVRAAGDQLRQESPAFRVLLQLIGTPDNPNAPKGKNLEMLSDAVEDVIEMSTYHPDRKSAAEILLANKHQFMD